MLTALLLSSALISTGVEAVLASPTVQLDAGGKAALVAAITAAFPSAVPATIHNYYCMRDHSNADEAKRNDLLCDGFYEDRVSDTDFVDLSIAGNIVKVLDTAPEGQVDVWRKAPRKRLESGSAAWTSTNGFVTQVFVGLAVADLLDFACQRDTSDETKIPCRSAYFDTVSDATYSTLSRTGFVVRPIRRVP